jgi:hypothetical protein
MDSAVAVHPNGLGSLLWSWLRCSKDRSDMPLSRTERFKLKSQLLDGMNMDNSGWDLRRTNVLLGEFGLETLDGDWNGPSFEDLIALLPDSDLRRQGELPRAAYWPMERAFASKHVGQVLSEGCFGLTARSTGAYL